VGLLAAVVGSTAAAGCGMTAATAMASHSGRDVRQLRSLSGRAAPSGWGQAELPGDGAVVAYPPDMHPVPGDQGTISFARFGPSGTYLMYLNATPQQGPESLRNWPTFRVGHLLDDDASSARLLASRRDVRFAGGTGSCVEDAYVTKVGAHRYTELACLVQGRSRASVIVAAAPTASWASVSGVLARSVSAYRVR
jgi:hypothetical protein